MSTQAHTHSTQPEHSPRLVLITAEPDETQSPQPLRIIGSEPRLTGNFRLTDR
jgi:hypothetical protein